MELSALMPAGHGIPDLRALGPNLYTRFDVAPLESARVLWLNEGWLLRSGVNVFDPRVREDVCRRLVAEYGVTACDEPSGGKGRRALFADLYGGTGGAPHGGSGRCGGRGLFNGKGIGRTPLTPTDVDWDHGHGFLWRTEAMREVIGAEIAAAELPHGAVPVVAIIDTGVDFRRNSDDIAQRRAIVVRPNFVRPAHFERSIFFGDAGKRDSRQYVDAQRVRQAVGAITKPGSDIDCASLREMFLRFARQIGAARAHRLWQGRFFTSNISIDGALVDFGSFRAVANWRNAFGRPGEWFGNETAHLRAAAESLCFYFRKFGAAGNGVPNANLLAAETDGAIDAAFRTAALDGLGVDRARDPARARELEELLCAYYQRQMSETVAVDDPGHLRWSWIYDLIRGPDAVARLRTSGDCQEALQLARLLLDARPDSEPPLVSAVTARRWLRPRHHLFFNTAARGAALRNRWLGDDAAANARGVAHYITTQVARSRRHWPLLPRHLEVLGHASSGYCSALYCRDRFSGERRLWLEGSLSGDRWCALGAAIPKSRLDVELHESGRGAGVEIAAGALDPRHGGEITVGGTTLRVPAALVRHE